MEKILHINPQLEIIGGMERYIEQFYMSFSGNFEVLALSLEKHNINLNIPKENIFSLDERVNNSIIAKIKKLIFRSKNIANFCNKNDINISISHGDIANIFNILSKFFGNKAKIIIIIHNAFDKNLLGIPLYYLCKFFYKFSDEIISVSKELSLDLQKQINNTKIKTIYNPFDFEKIGKLKNEKIEDNIEKVLNNGKINFCNVARLAPYKKQDLIIDYFNEYYKINENIQLFFIGEGDKKYMDLLLEKVNNYKLNNVIFFTGYKKNVYKYLKYVNYYLYLSGLQEGFGRGLIDALSLGIPILTHDYKYGAKEIIRNNNDFSICKDLEIHENGILTPYMDKEKYIKGVKLLMETNFDKEKIIKNTKKYDIENFIKEWNLILK
ncbi:MAG: glycosyltransferase [Candidatus Gracilibacteria bacterium]|nr:glycosyltransferase [Candidatus Gracilibacteria bacterium]